MRDISRRLHAGHPNWPGDTPLNLTQTAAIADGDSVNVMTLTTSTHCGTHIDAPYHYDAAGKRLGEIPLELLIGEAQVIHVTAGSSVTPDVLEEADSLPERVLFYTGQIPSWQQFPEGFTPLTAELIHALSKRGVKLVGTDSPSVDAFSSKDLPVHRACTATGLIIVEGLNLHEVAEGRYQLVCLPLSLPEADASPVRAILL